MRKRGVLVSLAITAGALAGSVAVAAPAQADSCSHSNFCFYYNSNGAGAFVRLAHDTPNLVNSEFVACGTSCAGLGQGVKNNAASARNTSSFYGARVFYNSDYRGASDYVATSTLRNLDNTYNQNASVLVFL